MRRLSVAVAVNQREEKDKSGALKPVPLADDERQRIEKLVGDAVGYNKERGDTISVASSPFVASAEPETPLAEGLHVAEQIRAAVATNPVEPVGALSISIGAAMVAGNDEEADATVRRADKCLYRAKSEGRNRVVGEAQDNVEPVSPAKARPGNQ